MSYTNHNLIVSFYNNRKTPSIRLDDGLGDINYIYLPTNDKLLTNRVTYLKTFTSFTLTDEEVMGDSYSSGYSAIEYNKRVFCNIINKDIISSTNIVLFNKVTNVVDENQYEIDLYNNLIDYCVEIYPGNVLKQTINDKEVFIFIPSYLGLT